PAEGVKMKVTATQSAGRMRLTVTPDGVLAAGHTYRLQLLAKLLTVSQTTTVTASDGTPTTVTKKLEYADYAPARFVFATHPAARTALRPPGPRTSHASMRPGAASRRPWTSRRPRVSSGASTSLWRGVFRRASRRT